MSSGAATTSEFRIFRIRFFHIFRTFRTFRTCIALSRAEFVEPF